MVEDNPDRKLTVIEFAIGNTFDDRGHFYDALKEFVIVNNFLA